MDLDQSVLSELLDAFRTGEGLDLIKEAAALVCQELIEVELSAQIGADRYERTSSRVNERNGHRPRVLSTKAGDVELAIPKLRKGSFFPSILEPRRRIDQALYAVVMEAYVHGVSTRAVDELVAALGVSSGISRSEVSRICGQLDEVVNSFRERRLDHVAFPYVYLDATYLHVRENHQVISKAVVIATGVSATGHREILGIDTGDSENEVFWREFLRKLRARGLEGVQLVISDQHAGLVGAIKRCFQGASHQRCRVHFARNLMAMIAKGHQPMVSAAFKTVFAQVSGPDMHTQWDQVASTLEDRLPKGAALMMGAKEEVLAFTAFPSEHWRQIWSTNPLERLNKELKRRCRVVGIFPNEASVIRLGGAVLLDVHDEWVATERRYFSESSMAKLYRVVDNDDAAVGEQGSATWVAPGSISSNTFR
ncbi:MAG TPA: IS256 family transposase [Acidimicrobiales bacterium]|nr:IS256 family transposase [Acidimicrobiales bacterium]